MAEAKLTIGARVFRVACEDGQEGYLQSAAALLDQYAKTTIEGNESISENQMLLMSGLMTADQAKALERENLNLQAYHKDLETRLSKLEAKAGAAVDEARKQSQKEIDDVKARLAEAQKHLKENQDLLVKANDEIQLGKAALAKSQAELKDIESSASSAGDSEALTKANEELKAANASLQTQISELNKKIEATSQGNESTEAMQKRLLELETQNNKWREETVRRDQEIERLTKIIEADQVERSEMRDDVKSDDKKSADLMADLLAGLERLAGD